MSDFERFWSEQGEWSQATFGTDAERGPIGPLKHLAKEVAEALADTSDREEYVDCFFLAIDAARRSGLFASPNHFLVAAFAKLKKNKQRKWGANTPDGAVEHIREDA